jgi:hypothetical protein
MTESAAPNAAWANEARWLRRECVFAHISLAVLLVLGSIAVWIMNARLDQLTHATKAMLAGQHEGSDAEQERALLAKLERENADWLYDAKGNTTKEGQAVRHYTEQAKRLGIDSTQARWDYACAMVERDLLLDVVEKTRKQADSEQRKGESRNAAPLLP